MLQSCAHDLSVHQTDSSSLHALTTPLILHANRDRRLGELLLRLSLAVRLVFLAYRLAANVLGLIAEKHKIR
jgi:hypothetical protein